MEVTHTISACMYIHMYVYVPFDNGKLMTQEFFIMEKVRQKVCITFTYIFNCVRLTLKYLLVFPLSDTRLTFSGF